MIGVGIAILENGKILLTKRRDLPVWCIPGGHLSPGESIVDAAIREAKEETGLNVDLTGLVGLYSLPYKGEGGSCEIILRGRPSGGNLTRATNETIDAAYYSIDELPSHLVGWQFHQAGDALSGNPGVLAILDANLSLGQIQEEVHRVLENGRASSWEWLNALCVRPNRVDLSSAQEH
jgi:ADP-ribose pyrophosphatase YjhB (NUDIX family)